LSYYRAALAAANNGCLDDAARLVKCSVLINENAPNNIKLLELLQSQTKIPHETLVVLRKYVESAQYKKALKTELPKTSKAHTIRGLLYALLKDYHKAKKEFIEAIRLDSGNIMARQALFACNEKRSSLINELLRMFRN